ncbi:MAG: DUF6580 family putative transport protein [Verrucomicrobiota bacterium]
MIPALLLVLAVVAYRVVAGLLIQSGAAPGLSNFTPLAGIALCCAAYLPRGYKFSVPLITLFLSDVILNASYGEAIFTPLILCRYLALLLVCLGGYALARSASLRTMLPASLAGSTLFYALTNIFSWATDPGYAKTFAGLVQSLTVGLPQYSPTWMFFRNSLVSDLIFTAFFVLSIRVTAPRSHARLAPAPSI